MNVKQNIIYPRTVSHTLPINLSKIKLSLPGTRNRINWSRVPTVLCRTMTPNWGDALLWCMQLHGWRQVEANTHRTHALYSSLPKFTHVGSNSVVTVAQLMPRPTSTCNNNRLSAEQMLPPNYRTDAYATFATILVDCEKRRGRYRYSPPVQCVLQLTPSFADVTMHRVGRQKSPDG